MKAEAPAVDAQQARQFIRVITGSEDTPVTFQAFGEGAARKNRRLARILHGTLKEHFDTLVRLNELGAGVFLTINETDLLGRENDNMKSVRAVFLDLDDLAARPLELVKTLPLQPHATVESSDGKAHAYWKVTGFPLSLFKPVQTLLIERYGGDEKVKDVTRVMRLPGFLHRKSEAAFKTRILNYTDAPPYSLDEINRGLLPGAAVTEESKVPAVPRVAPKRKKLGSERQTDQMPKIQSALAALPADAWNDRELWLRVGMALHTHGTEFDSEACYALWCEHAQASKKYDEDDSRKTWASFSEKRNGITLGTLFHEAKKYGWRAPRDSRFSLEDDGVYFRGLDKHGDPLPSVRICGPLEVVAEATDQQGGNWGLLIEFQNRWGASQAWVMPAGLLAGDAAEVRAELLNRGLWIGTNKTARDQLTSYLGQAEGLPRAVYVTTPGWYGNTYVLPDRTIGSAAAGERIVFQGAVQSRFDQRGTLEHWRERVAALAIGNSRLAFAISTAFAAPLLHMAGADAGGFHFGGDSSQGKTSIVRAAASVWGGREYIHTWRATANGLEGVAQQHNDGLLVLDELNQVEPGEAGEAAYMLANGRGKARAARSGAARPLAQWRLLYLSTGELGLAAHMAKAGHRVEAGQAVRLVEIPADAERGLGIYDELRGKGGGAALSAELVAAAAECYGVAGLRFLEQIAAGYDKTAFTLNELVGKFTAELMPPGAEGQAQRVVARFALVAAAGVLATRFGLTGWPEGQALQAAQQCFRAWLAARGGAGNQERRAILHQVRKFLELHGRSRFQRMDARDCDRMISNRAGFYDEDDDGTRFYILREAYNGEVCLGRDPRAVSKILIAERWLIPDTEGKSARSMGLPGIGQTRCYVMSPRALQGEIE